MKIFIYWSDNTAGDMRRFLCLPVSTPLARYFDTEPFKECREIIGRQLVDLGDQDMPEFGLKAAEVKQAIETHGFYISRAPL